jgi:beta-lactamase regulating signal transducer with metallopeptidase domain
VSLAVSSALLGLIWFAVTNLIATLLACLLVGATASRRLNAGALLVLRLMPAALSTLFVAFVFLPAHIRYEPAESDESLGFALRTVAVLTVMLLARSVWRAATIIRTDLKIAAQIQRLGRPHGDALEMHGLAGVSLAGILRPRILIGSSARAALTPAELDVAISHESAHRRSLDNLKRFVICCAPDVFGLLPIARRLENRWEAETECQADARAVGGDTSRAVVLASALVKVARLARPPQIQPSWSSFHVATLLETRVRRLVDEPPSMPRRRTSLWCAAGLAAAALSAAAWSWNLPYAIHVATETLVTYLP